MAVGIKDIARRAGFSEATVSLALNGSNLVNEHTKEIILEIAQEIGYIPNLSARNLARRESGCLGLIIPDVENVFYASLVKYINDATKEKGYNLIIAVSENNPQAEKKIISNMIENRVEGVVFVPMNKKNSNPDYVTMLDHYYIPYVFCSDYYKMFRNEAPVVMSDLENGMYQQVLEVVAMGYKNLVYLTGDDAVESLYLRRKGFERAVQENGVQSRVYRLDKLSYKAARSAISEILENYPETDAFVCVNDMIAVGALNALAEQGISVPEEKGIAGFDNVIFSRISFPQISTVEQDIEEIAKKSVEILIEKNRQHDDVIIPTKIIKRGSLHNQK